MLGSKSLSKNLLILSSLLFFTIFIPKTVGAAGGSSLDVGDIAFIGLNSDGDDDFSLLLLTDITAETSFYITDKGWSDGTGFLSDTADGTWKWSASSAMSAGDIIHIKTSNDGATIPDAFSSTPGSMSWEYAGAIISYTGDQIFIFQGSEASPAFIAGAHWNVETVSTSGNWDGAASTMKTSALPNQLLNGTNAIWLYDTGTTESDNFIYNCSTTSGTPAALRTAINDISNWSADNSTPFTLNSFPCSFTVNSASDVVPPVITCPPTPSPIVAGSNGKAAIPDLATTTTATDDVSIPADITIVQSPTAGSMVNTGVHSVVLTATDEAGNFDTCTVDVTVNEPPSTTLSAGDIAFIGINSDGNDDFAFVLLENIIAGTKLNIADHGWIDGSSSFRNEGGDGELVWYASDSISAGTIVHFQTTNNGASLSTAVASQGSTTGNVGVSQLGDQLFIYQGTALSPTFITGIHWNVEAISNSLNWDDGAAVAINATTSDLPDQLTNGTNAIWLFDVTQTDLDLKERDNFKYNCSTTTGSVENLRTAVVNLANWNVDLANTTPYTINPFPCSFTVSTNVAPTVTAPSAPTVAEDDTNVALDDDIQVADTDSDDQTVSFTITGGTLTTGTAGITFGGSGNGSASFTAAGTLAAINTALDAATFTSTPDLNGTNAATIAFTTNDGTDSSSQASVSFDISAVNDDPTLTAFSTIVETTDPNTEVEITFAEMVAQGDENDIDGTVDAFIVEDLSTGTLKIGANSSAATVFNSVINNIIDAVNNAYWTPATDVDGVQNAFTVIAEDDLGAESTGEVQATVKVNDVTNPEVTGITISGTPLAGASSIDFVVAFDEEVKNVSIDDFSLKNLSGTANGTVDAVSASAGTTINVTVNSITGSGTLRLDLDALTNIADVSDNTPPAAYTSGSVHTVDRTAPTLSSSVPNDEAINIDATANITLTFSKNIAFGVGNIQLIDLTDGTRNITIDAASPGIQANILSNTLTINPSINLDEFSNYSVQIAATALDDVYGNSYAGISNNTTLNFQTADLTPPTLSSSIPSDNATNAFLGGNIVLTFDDELAIGTGNVSIKHFSDDSDFEIIPIGDARISVSSNQLTINPTSNFSPGVEYYIEMDATALDDDASNSFTGISGNSTLNFSTVDVVINEVVTDPKQDWSDDGFMGTPGAGGITNGTDEWVELFIKSDGIDLTTGWTIEISSQSFSGDLNAGGAFEISNYSGSGSVSNTNVGGFLVLGNVTGAAYMNLNTILTLKDPSGVVVDQITFVNPGSPSTNSDNIYNETAQRFPNGIDTDVGSDWTQGEASLGAPNTGPSVTLSISDTTIAEATGISTITATLSQISSQTVTITLTENISSTASGTDFGISSHTIVINSGSTIGTAILTATQDLYDENNETIIVDIIGVTNGTEAGVQQQTITIIDDDAMPTVEFSTASSATIDETGMFSVSVQLSAISNLDVVVPITATPASASDGGIDYTAPLSIVTIPVGSQTGNVIIPITPDLLVETDETFFIHMGMPTNATQGAITTHAVTITNDDLPSVQFSTASQTLSGESGTHSVVISLSGASTTDITIPFTISGSSTATLTDDYTTSATSPLTIPAGSTSVSIPLQIQADTLDEDTETIIFELGTPTNATLGTNTTYTFTINDNDPTPSVTFEASSQTTFEESGLVEMRINMSAVSGLDVTIPFSIVAPSTLSGAGVDYSITSSPITILAGATTASIYITPTHDLLDENHEYLRVQLGTPTNATLGMTDLQILTIRDDDPTPTVTFTTASQSSTDETGTMTITAQLSAVSGLDISVPFSVNGLSTATNTSDYLISTSPIAISAGSSSGSVTITIVPEILEENDETVIIDMGVPTNATLGTNTTHTAIITNDDHIPSIPNNFVGAVMSGSVSLTWDDSAHATGYEVYRSANRGSGYSLLISLTTLEYEDSTVAEGATYFYKVLASNSIGNSGLTDEIALTVSSNTVLTSRTEGQADLPAGSTEMTMSGSAVVDFSGNMSTSSGGSIVTGGSSKPLNNFTSGDLTGVDLSGSQRVGDQNVIVAKSVKIKSGNSGSSVSIKNSNFPTGELMIPDGTTIMGPSGWNGQIVPPQAESTAGTTAPSGFSVGSTVVEVGAAGQVLLFDQPVSVILDGVHSSVGYKPAGSTNWVRITATCGGTYANPAAPTFPGECFIADSVNGKTKIYTFHLTSFANLSANSSSSSSSSSSSGGGGGGSFYNTTSPYKISETVSSTVANVTNRGLDLSKTKGVINRPVVLKNTTLGISLEIPQGTKVTTQETEFLGTIEMPERLSSRQTPALPENYTKIFGVAIDADEEVNFDKVVVLKLPVELAEETKAENVKVFYYNEVTKQYELVGEGGELSEDGTYISIEIQHLSKYVVMDTGGEELVNIAPELIEKDIVIEVEEVSVDSTSDGELKDIKGHWAYRYIKQLQNEGIVSGKQSGLFEPNTTTTRAELTKMVLLAFDYAIPADVSESDFSDVKVSDWYAPYVMQAKEFGLIEGYTDGTFKPNQEINRVEALKIVLAASKLQIQGGEMEFEDTTTGAWYEKYIAYSQLKGIVGGYSNGSFGPNNSITRAECAKIIVKVGEVE